MSPAALCEGVVSPKIQHMHLWTATLTTDDETTGFYNGIMNNTKVLEIERCRLEISDEVLENGFVSLLPPMTDNESLKEQMQICCSQRQTMDVNIALEHHKVEKGV